MIIRARCILPICSPPIDNGAMKVVEGRIKQIGRYEDIRSAFSGEVVDLQEVAICPGLVNAHCHLDYTDMAGLLPPVKHFPDWIKSILSLKAHWSFTEYAQSWVKGAKMLVNGGVTTVADIEAVPELIPEVWSSTPLRVLSFFEMTGVKSNRAPSDILAEAMAQQEKFSKGDRFHQFGLSPHSPYSTTPELLKLAAKAARELQAPLSIHAAESESEFQMFRSASGPFYDWLKSQRSMSDCHGASPIQLLNDYGLLGERSLVIHANYLAESDPLLLARAKATVVHCPRSHAYFGHDPFPWRRLKEAGVNVALGTDSLASAAAAGPGKPELDMRLEMRLFAQNHGAAPEEAMRMGTERAAKGLGMAAEAGLLKEGAFADFFSFAYAGRIDERKATETFIFAEAPITETWIAGKPITGVHAERFA
jgi:cytosine/adenosine deaminase-related metal-dependent hydrolase